MSGPKLMIISVTAILLILMIVYYRGRNGSARGGAAAGGTERFRVGGSSTGFGSGSPYPESVSSASLIRPSNSAAFPAASGSPASPVSSCAGSAIADPFPQDRIQPAELLPKDAANSAWAKANPAGQGDVMDQNFLTAGYHIGFDTQGSSLRNPNYDIRSTPINPRYRVSIWQQSTIDPDLNRRPLE